MKLSRVLLSLILISVCQSSPAYDPYSGAYYTGGSNLLDFVDFGSDLGSYSGYGYDYNLEIDIYSYTSGMDSYYGSYYPSSSCGGSYPSFDSNYSYGGGCGSQNYFPYADPYSNIGTWPYSSNNYPGLDPFSPPYYDTNPYPGYPPTYPTMPPVSGGYPPVSYPPTTNYPPYTPPTIPWMGCDGVIVPCPQGPITRYEIPRAQPPSLPTYPTTYQPPTYPTPEPTNHVVPAPPVRYQIPRGTTH